MSKFVKINQNPFGKIIGDCTIRAVSLGTNTPYEEVCKMFGKKFKKGLGLDDKGVDPVHLYRFAEKYKTLKSVWFDERYIKWAYQNKPYEYKFKERTLKEFCDKITGQYILCLRPEVNFDADILREWSRGQLHTIYCNASKGEYYDNEWERGGDQGDMRIFWVYRVIRKSK